MSPAGSFFKNSLNYGVKVWSKSWIYRLGKYTLAFDTSFAEPLNKHEIIWPIYLLKIYLINGLINRLTDVHYK